MFKRGDSVRTRGLSLGMKSIPGCSWGECTLFILFVIFGGSGVGFLVCPAVTGAVTLRAVTRDCLFVRGTETGQERRGGTGQVFINDVVITISAELTHCRTTSHVSLFGSALSLCHFCPTFFFFFI